VLVFVPASLVAFAVGSTDRSWPQGHADPGLAKVWAPDQGAVNARLDWGEWSGATRSPRAIVNVA